MPRRVLGPRAKIRAYIMETARRNASYQELLAGWAPPSHFKNVISLIEGVTKKVSNASARAWATCLRKVFEIEPLLCLKCGIEMVPVAAITQDPEIERLLKNLNLPADFPKTKPARSPSAPLFGQECTARSPPLPLFNEECQVDPVVDAWHGIDDQPPGYWATA